MEDVVVQSGGSVVVPFGRSGMSTPVFFSFKKGLVSYNVGGKEYPTEWKAVEAVTRLPGVMEGKIIIMPKEIVVMVMANPSYTESVKSF